MPGNNEAIGLLDRGVFGLGEQKPPKNHRRGRWSRGHGDNAVALHCPYKGQSSVWV